MKLPRSTLGLGQLALELTQDLFEARELRVIRQGAVDLGLGQFELLPHRNNVLAQTIAIGHELLDGLLDVLGGGVHLESTGLG